MIMVRMNNQSTAVAAQEFDRTAPSTGLMHLGFVLTGLGTMLLGPILPLLSHQWHLTDAQSGSLLLAQFCGSFLGGVSVSPRLRRDLLIGFLASAMGLTGFAIAPGLGWACLCIAVGGAGIGRAITAINIVAGQRFTTNRGAALMRLNLTLSFGAMLSPLLAAWLTPRFPLQAMLELFASLFLVCALILLAQSRGLPTELVVAGELKQTHRLDNRTFVFFAALLVLYGGLETSLNGWLTTFALRYGTTSAGHTATLALSEYTLFTGRIFPQNHIEAGSLLVHLLRHIFHPPLRERARLGGKHFKQTHVWKGGRRRG